MHVGLVDAGDAALGGLARAPLVREPEGELEQPLGPFPRRASEVVRLVGGRGRHGFRVVAPEEPAFALLANEHEIDVARARVGERQRHAGDGADRPHAGVEVEPGAQLELRRDFGAVGVAHVGQAHRPEEDRVGALARVHRSCGESDAGLPVKLRAAREALAREPEAADSPLQALEHRETGVHDLDADAVAGENCDPEAVVRAH